jgi:hypothetical protein
MKTNRDWLRATRAAGLIAFLAWSLSLLGCSGSGGQCLNPQPLPPFCSENPQPLPPSNSGSTPGSALAGATGGDAAAPDDRGPLNPSGPDASSFDAGGPDASSFDAGVPDASSLDGGQCHWQDGLYDGGPGVCAVARAYLACTDPVRGACHCLSDDPTSCPECGPSTGAVCKSLCASNEYAVSCGGPLDLLADGGVLDDQSAPAACTIVTVTPAGNTYACCPCP